MSGYNTDWLQFIDSSGSDYLTSVAYDYSNNYVYTCGYSNATSRTITVSGINYTKPNGLNQAAYIARFNTSGGGLLTNIIDGSGSEISNIVRIDNSGNVYYLGTTTSQGATGITISGGGSINTYLNPRGNSGTGICYLVKILPSYAVSWVQFFDVSGGGVIEGFTMTLDNSGFVYIAGGASNLTSAVNISGVNYARPAGSTGTFGSYIIKYNPDGAMQWFQNIDGAGTEYIDGITTDSSANLYVSCRTLGSATISISGISITKPGGSSVTTYFIVKYNPNGAYQIVRFIDTASTGSLTGNFYIDCNKNTNYIYVYGFSSSASTSINISGVAYPKPGSAAISTSFIVKMTPDIVVDTVKWILNTQDTNKINIYNNNVYVTGYGSDISISGIATPFILLNSNGNYIVKLDLSLNPLTINLYETIFTGAPSYYQITEVTVDNSSNIYSVYNARNDMSGIYPDYLTYVKPYGKTDSSSINKYRSANIPVTPSNFATTGLSGRINTSWDTVLDGNIYKVSYGISGSFGLSGFSRVTTLTLSGLQGGTWYNLYLTALNIIGESTATSTIYALTIPDTVTSITINSGSNSADLSWNEVTGASQYNIYYGLSGIFDLSASFTTLSGTISDLTPDVWYNFRITSSNSSGESNPSIIVYTIPKFSPPGAPIIVPNLVSFDLSWSPIVGASGYIINYGLSGYYSYSATSTNVYTTVSGLVPNQYINVTIQTYGNNIQSTSPYSTPSYSMARSYGPATISGITGVESTILYWESVYNISGYKIYYGLSGSYDLSLNVNFP